ncbi:MAG: hypothetical protein J1E31_07795 [Helicobacter sp.]|nr:hypothetical protein [Helicobacter sp.]
MKKILILLIFSVLTLFAKEGTMEIKLSFENNEMIVLLEDNAAARELYEMLPLKLNFSDYARKEKVAHLPKNLSLSNTQGYNPQIGDFFYFSPWGNIGIYYEKQPPYQGLVYLGKIKGDVSKLRGIKADFEVLITRVE